MKGLKFRAFHWLGFVFAAWKIFGDTRLVIGRIQGDIWSENTGGGLWRRKSNLVMFVPFLLADTIYS